MDSAFRNHCMTGTVFLAAVLLLDSCMATPGGQVRRFIDVPEKKAVLVGKVMISPPVRAGEQVLKTSFGKRFENVFILYCGEQIRDFRYKRPETYAGSFAVTPEEPFYLEVDKGTTLYISGGTFYAVFDPPYSIEAFTYAGLYTVDVEPDDEAIYIGTIQYLRDEQNKLRMVVVRDDYNAAVSEFKKRFTTSVTPRRALLTPLVLTTESLP